MPPIVVYANQPFPTSIQKSIFLAGPTPRDPDTKSWRPEAIRLLEELGYDGHVFVPEDEDGVWKAEYEGQVGWEDEGLHRADCAVFWIPRDLTGETYGGPMPAFTSNDEWGFWKDSGKAVLGAPPWAQKVKYQRHYAEKLGVPVADNLRDTLKNAVEMIGDGDLRKDGECHVPLHVWRKKEFKEWYLVLRLAGNRLDKCRVAWSFFAKSGRMHVYALHVEVFVTMEGRSVSNEVVIFRPDLTAVIIYERGKSLADTRIVLVREFRNAVRNGGGYVYELPSGSGTTAVDAAKEVKEETGLDVDPNDLVMHASRQAMATLSAHHARLYSIGISSEEMDRLAQDHSIHGENDQERTTIMVLPVREALSLVPLDWSMIGMILSVALGRPNESPTKP